MYKDTDFKKVTEIELPFKKRIVDLYLFQKINQLFILLTNKKLLSIDTIQNEVNRVFDIPEQFVAMAYSKSTSSMFTVGLCGKIYRFDMKFYYSLQCLHLTQANLENWRMLTRPIETLE